MSVRFIISIMLIGFYTAVSNLYPAAEGSIQGRIAASTVQDSDANYATAMALLTSHSPITLIGWATILVLLVIWVPVLLRLVKRSPKKASVGTAAIIAAIIGTGCVGPYKVEKFETIESNETAFVVPLEGATLTNQAKFMSIDYLNSPEVKVATKRIPIPQRKRETGRMAGDFEYIDTVRVIKVNRAPITRQWVKATTQGTSKSDEAIEVESKESIDFFTGVVCSGFISEEDAARFLYYFAGKPLSEVMDENVRGYVQNIMWVEFGTRDLTAAKEAKKDIMDSVSKATKEFFAKQGITISYVGGAEGLTYVDHKIQDSINSAFIAENDRKVADQENQAQAIRNTKLVSIATAQRLAAEEFAKAQNAMIAKTQLEIQMKQADAMLEIAHNSKGISIQPGAILPQGSGFLFGLDKALPGPVQVSANK